MKYSIEFHREMVCVIAIEASSEKEAMEIAEGMDISEVDTALGGNDLEYESGWQAAMVKGEKLPRFEERADK